MRKPTAVLVAACSVLIALPASQTRAVDATSNTFLDSTVNSYASHLHFITSTALDLRAIVGGTPTSPPEWQVTVPGDGYSGFFTSEGGVAGVRSKIRMTVFNGDAKPGREVFFTIAITDFDTFAKARRAVVNEFSLDSIGKLKTTTNPGYFSAYVEGFNPRYQSFDSYAAVVVPRGNRTMVAHASCIKYGKARRPAVCSRQALESAIAVVSDYLQSDVVVQPVSTRPPTAPTVNGLRLVSVIHIEGARSARAFDSTGVLAASFAALQAPASDEPYAWTGTDGFFLVDDAPRLNVQMLKWPIGPTGAPLQLASEICDDSSGEASNGCVKSQLPTSPGLIGGWLAKTRNSFEDFVESQAVTNNTFLAIGCARPDYSPMTKKERQICTDLVVALVKAEAAS